MFKPIIIASAIAAAFETGASASDELCGCLSFPFRPQPPCDSWCPATLLRDEGPELSEIEGLSQSMITAVEDAKSLADVRSPEAVEDLRRTLDTLNGLPSPINESIHSPSTRHRYFQELEEFER